MKEKIARWYKQDLWTKEWVLLAVEKKTITAEEAEEILALKK